MGITSQHSESRHMLAGEDRFLTVAARFVAAWCGVRSCLVRAATHFLAHMLQREFPTSCKFTYYGLVAN